MRLTGPMRADLVFQPRSKQVSSTHPAHFSSNSIAARGADSFALSRPRFGASQGGGTEVDYSAGAYATGSLRGDDGDDPNDRKKRGSCRRPLPEDAKPLLALPDNWDALLRKAMREEAKRVGKKADVNAVIHKFERQYGSLPTHVFGTKNNNKSYSLSEQLRRTKEDYLRAGSGKGRGPDKRTETSDVRRTIWTPCYIESLQDRRNKKVRSEDPVLPSFSDIASKAGSESCLPTEDRYTLAANSGTAPPNLGNAPVVRSRSPIGWRQSRADNNLWRYHHGNGQYSEWNTREYWDNKGNQS